MKRGKIAFKARYHCQAHGLHAETCPGKSSTWVEGIRGRPWREFDKHHMQKQAWGGGDDLDNFLWVFHDCHIRIHQNETEALKIGLLKNPPKNAHIIN